MQGSDTTTAFVKNAMASVAVKSDYKGDLRRFTFHVDEKVSFVKLQTQLATLYNLSSPIQIRYKDDEDDLVTLSSNAELLDAISISPQLLRLKLFLSELGPPATSVTGADPLKADVTSPLANGALPEPLIPGSTPPVADLTPQPDAITVANVQPAQDASGLVPSNKTETKIDQQEIAAAVPDLDASLGISLSKISLAKVSTLLSMFLPFAVLFDDADVFKQVSPVTKEAFWTLARDLVDSNYAQALLDLVPRVLHRIRSWLTLEFTELGVVAQEHVDSVTQAITEECQEIAGDELTKRICAFFRLSLADPSVALIVRRTSNALRSIEATTRNDAKPQQEGLITDEESARLLGLAQRRKRKRMSFFNEEDGIKLRLYVRGHELRQEDKEKYCALCGGNRDGWRGHRSTFKCNRCNVHLCVRLYTPFTNNCWDVWHSSKRLEPRKTQPPPTSKASKSLNEPEVVTMEIDASLDGNGA